MAAERRTHRSSSTPQPPLIGFRSRRSSLASLTSRAPHDKEALAQALDEIHTTASKSDTLTSFSDYDGRSGARGSGPKELVTSGFSGLYSRLRQSVGAGSQSEAARPASRSSYGRAETASIVSNTSSQAKPKADRISNTAPFAQKAVQDVRSINSEASSLVERDTRAPHVGRALTENTSSPVRLSVEPANVIGHSASSSMTANDVASTVEKTSDGRSNGDSYTQADMQEPTGPTINEETRKRASVVASDITGGSLDTSAILTDSDESDDALEGESSNAVGKRLSMQSQQSMGTPDSKTDRSLARKPTGQGNKKSVTLYSRNDDGLSLSSTTHPSSSPLGVPRRALERVNEARSPISLDVSRASSATDASEAIFRSRAKPLTPSKGTEILEEPQNLNAGFRRNTAKPQDPIGKSQAIVPAHLKRRVVSKEFWMRDENARDCFYCGDTFSTFRRKHHCRTCGQIFDAKCTTLVPGRPFDLPGTLRLCKPCEGVIYGSDDDSTVFTDEEDNLRSALFAEVRKTQLNGEPQLNGTAQSSPRLPALTTPSIGIPASRRNREAKRRSAVIEFDSHHPLARPSSSRSLKSLGGRPRSSSHRRHQSRHQQLRSLKHTMEERGPFSQETGDSEQRQPLSAFHNDNIIDPDLAAFLSDEGSEEEQPSLFSVLNDAPPSVSFVEGEKAGLSSFLTSAVKKGRSRLGDRSTGAPSVTTRDADGGNVPSRQNSKLARKRNPSIASITYPRPSPRRSRSQHLLRGFEELVGGTPLKQAQAPAEEPIDSGFETKIKRSAAMHGSDAPKVELNRASLQHVRRLLAQLLQDNNIPRWRSWEKALLPILLQCTDDVDPDVQRGDDMDVRNYIKLKKIPGGRPGDTAYVSGVVFSKNIALKSMRRNFIRPRIVVVTFAIEYARHNQHFMSLEPVIAQEREYLRSLVGRIAALQPHVLLVQRNVSGLALQMLQEADITVVYNVKESVLAAVARVTRTIMIKTVDKLSMDPSHLGQCGSFDVKTYIHSGTKKTYIYISGCQPSLGCTVVLRGAGTDALRQVKRTTEFMCYVVYNLRLETSLMRDEFVLIPSLDSPPVLVHKPSEPQKTKLPLLDVAASVSTATQTDDADHATTLADRDVRESPDPDVSQPVAHADGLPPVKGQDEPEETPEHADDDAMPSQYRDLVQTSRTRIISSSPFVKFVEPYLLMQAQESEQRVEKFKRLRDQYINTQDGSESDQEPTSPADFEMVAPEMVQEAQSTQQSKAMRHFLLDVHEVQYQRALHEYEAKKKQWESFFAGSNGNPFDPFTHQNIFVLQSLVSSITYAPCAGPEVIGLSFYAGYESSEFNYEEDCTLGQFVEDICMGANTACKTCNRKLVDHHRQYVHGSGQLSVSVKRYPSKIKGLANSILMWSSCKVCNQETTVIPMSDNTWKYSFGKYLELSFWSTPLKPRAGLCPHDIHKDFVRYFGFHDQCVRVQYDKIEIYDVFVPSSTINWAVNSDLNLKNQLYSDCVAKLNAFITSVKARLKSINVSTVVPEKMSDATAAVEKLMQRAEDDRNMLLDKMQTKYMSSRFYEVVPLNRAVRAMDEKAIAWDDAFVDFERNYFPSETDIRRLATLQLKKLFLDRNEAAPVQNTDSEVEEGVEMEDRTPQPVQLTDDEMHSEKAQDMLNAVVEEQSASETQPSVLHNDLSVPEKQKELMSPIGGTLSRILSPEETERIVDREDVKHLDLAIPIIPTELPSLELSSVAGESTSPIIPTSSEGASASLPTEPKPLNSIILERIEQMRSAATAAANSDNSSESKIPRLTDLHRRSAGITVSPGLSRAQSQPTHVSRGSEELASEMPSIESVTAAPAPDDGGQLAPPQSFGDISKSVEQRLIERLGGGPTKAARAAQNSLIPRSVPSKADPYNTTRVSALAKHFEQLSREFERERLRERRLRAARSRQNRANPLASSRPVVEVYHDASEAVSSKADELKVSVDQTSTLPTLNATENTSDEQDRALLTTENSVDHHELNDQDTTDHYTDTEMAESTLGHGTSDTDAEGDLTDTEQPSIDLPSTMRKREQSDPTSGTSSTTLLSPSVGIDLDLTLPKHEKSSLMKMLSSFWSERSASGWSPLEYPLHQTEHVFEDSDIIVREDEPSSVIALALSSVDYTRKLNEFRQSPRSRGHAHSASQGSTLSPEEALKQAAIEASLISETGTHMKYSFAHNQVKAQCKIFYAESFDALRRKCGVSERFVESLSRSIKWDSKGGKTKSLFLKTLDDRFVIKSLQEVELKAFTRFAPDYFAFMSHTLFHGVPSVIAKMFGLFQVIIKNPATGVEFSSYLLVMENLFYDRRPTRRFDLKGSMRNRKIESTGQPDEVLLDENLVETIFETPLFVREHARKLVKASVWNDTMWLCKQNVMDYSLMAGFDDERKELYIGIIDCIRTYTWDKKLESWIKDRGKNKPTITSPKDYRNRFRVSMMQYVLQSPNVYHEFSRQLPAPASLKAVVEERERFLQRKSGAGGGGVGSGGEGGAGGVGAGAGGGDRGGGGEQGKLRNANVEAEQQHYVDEATITEMGSVMV